MQNAGRLSDVDVGQGLNIIDLIYTNGKQDFFFAESKIYFIAVEKCFPFAFYSIEILLRQPSYRKKIVNMFFFFYFFNLKDHNVTE